MDEAPLSPDQAPDQAHDQDPDSALLPGALRSLLSHAAGDAAAAAFECRQQPYEHPKNYHPVTLETARSCVPV